MESYITSLATAVPENKIEQAQIADFMVRTLKPDQLMERKIRALYKATGIKERYSVLPDYTKVQSSENIFFPPNDDLEPFPAVAERMKWYNQFASDLAGKAAEKALSKKDRTKISHLITVSCTGMQAPGLDIQLVEKLGLAKTVHRTCINFMGCYAMMNALKVADAFVKADPDSKVLVVSVELSSIHFQKNISWDHLLSNALFADGAGAVVVEGEPKGKNFRIGNFFATMNTDGMNEMGWEIGNLGFEMTLTSKVPDYLLKGLGKSLGNLKNELKLTGEPEYYAIHPGGRKILSAAEKALDITREQNRFAYSVMKEYGNMSSATIIFVLEMIFNQEQKPGPVLIMAFGPGLTVESAAFEFNNITSTEHQKNPGKYVEYA